MIVISCYNELTGYSADLSSGYCGNEPVYQPERVSSTDCNMACEAEDYEFCGGNSSLALYSANDNKAQPSSSQIPTTSPGVSTDVSLSTTMTPSMPTSPSPSGPSTPTTITTAPLGVTGSPGPSSSEEPTSAQPTVYTSAITIHATTLVATLNSTLTTLRITQATTLTETRIWSPSLQTTALPTSQETTTRTITNDASTTTITFSSATITFTQKATTYTETIPTPSSTLAPTRDRTSSQPEHTYPDSTKHVHSHAPSGSPSQATTGSYNYQNPPKSSLLTVSGCSTCVAVSSSASPTPTAFTAPGNNIGTPSPSSVRGRAIGAAIGAFAAVLLVAGLVWWWMRKKGKKAPAGQDVKPNLEWWDEERASGAGVPGSSALPGGLAGPIRRVKSSAVSS